MIDVIEVKRRLGIPDAPGRMLDKYTFQICEDPMKCFYHSADLDGKCSAAIVRRKYPEIELIGINYGEPFPWGSIEHGEPVIMVDFALQPFSDMLRLAELASLVWIDHHKTAMAEADKAGWFHEGQREGYFVDDQCFVPGLRRIGRGACAWTWEYLFSDEQMPRSIQLIAAYDVWDHHAPDCLPFQNGMSLVDNGPEAEIWRMLIYPGMMTEDRAMHQIVIDGTAIMEYRRRQSEAGAKSLCFDVEIDGLKLLAANVGQTNSQFFDSQWDPEKYHAMCAFVWRPSAGAWSVSLYSTRADVDCGSVCKARGGGGHKGAAGFQCDELPFVLGRK